MKAKTKERSEFKKPSKLLLIFSKLLLNVSNKKIIAKAKKDTFFKQFIENYKAKIQFTSRDGYINKYIIFNGKEPIKYSDGKLDNPDATIIYRSVKDIFIFYKKFGDLHDGLVENRFEMSGNLNLLFKYGFLTTYINPKVTKMPIKKKLE